MTPAQAALVFWRLENAVLITAAHLRCDSPHIDACQARVLIDDYLDRDELLAVATWYEQPDAVTREHDALRAGQPPVA